MRRVKSDHPEITWDLLGDLPALLTVPAYVFEFATRHGRMVSTVTLLPDGRHVIVAIEPNRENFDGHPAVAAKSFYAKDDPAWLTQQIRQGRTLYARDGIEPGLIANASRSNSGQPLPRQVSNTPGSRWEILRASDVFKDRPATGSRPRLAPPSRKPRRIGWRRRPAPAFPAEA